MEKPENFIKNGWSDYYEGSVSPGYTKNAYNSQIQLTSSSNIYIFDCLFNSITSGTDGGAILATTTPSLLIESTLFSSCKTTANEGGAIYFVNTGTGQSVMNKVCGIDCCSTYSSSTSYGQFAFTYVKDNINNKNYVNFTSIAHCINTITNSLYTIEIADGKISIQGVNITKNKCYSRSAFYLQSAAVTSSLLYSSFVNNTALGYNCIYLCSSSQKEMKNCNVIRNTRGSSTSEGTIRSNGNLNIYESCILENNASYVFYAASGYTITLSNCTTDASNKKSGNLVVSNTAEVSFINALVHFKTGQCEAYFDSVGSLTVQPTKKRRNTICTCIYKRPMIDPHRLITFMFVITFISS